jgi:hypothetical protein
MIVHFVDIGGIIDHHCLRKVWRYQRLESVIRKRRDNTMAKRKTKQNTTHNSCASEGSGVPAPPVAPVVLL